MRPIWSEKIGDGGAAAEAYERVLKMDPSHAAASAALEEVYRQRKVWPSLVELLLARVEYTGETEEKIKLFCEIARIYEEHNR